MKASKYVLATHGVDSDGDFATKYVKVSGNYFLTSLRTEHFLLVINSGSIREPELQNSLRKIALIAAHFLLNT